MIDGIYYEDGDSISFPATTERSAENGCLALCIMWGRTGGDGDKKK